MANKGLMGGLRFRGWFKCNPLVNGPACPSCVGVGKCTLLDIAGGTARCNVKTQWGAHTAWVVRHENDLIPIPEGVSFMEGAVSKLAAISHHGVALSLSGKGSRVAVVGLGPIGQFAARLHHAVGAKVVGGIFRKTGWIC